MVKRFESGYNALMGYPAPTEKWSEKDLWEWVAAGRPGNPPWNPLGTVVDITGKTKQQVIDEKNAIIDASGNRDVYEMHKTGAPGSVKRSQFEAGMITRQRWLDSQRNRNLLWAAGIGVGLLALFGMGS